jgi:hypothetical protein
MFQHRCGALRLALALLVLFPGWAAATWAQGPPVAPPLPLPPGRPAEPEPPAEKEEPPELEPILEESDAPWELPPELLAKLAEQAERYREFALRFTCTEEARVATYDQTGEASKETLRSYAYLLERDESGATLREFRQRAFADGAPRGRPVQDEEPFPPAYAWVFLFSEFHQGYFAYRDLGERFDGFDWVREIQFRGALPFTDGRDIRQWQGTVLVDATAFTPLEIRAEPGAQEERMRALFDRWSQSFNLMGFRTAPRPFGYRCHVKFRMQREALTFPTELRYDTYRAVSLRQRIPWRASIRVYKDYRFFKTAAEPPVYGPEGTP